MSWLSEFAGSGGLGILPQMFFNQGSSGGGSKRDGAPQIPTGLPNFNPNMGAPANYWQGNQLQIPGAQGLGATPPPAMPQAPAQQPHQFGGGLMGALQGLMGGQGGGMGGLAGLLSGIQGGQQGTGGQMPGSGSSTLPTQGQPPLGMAQAGGGMNPGIQQLMALLQQRQQ